MLSLFKFVVVLVSLCLTLNCLKADTEIRANVDAIGIGENNHGQILNVLPKPMEQRSNTNYNSNSNTSDEEPLGTNWVRIVFLAIIAISILSLGITLAMCCCPKIFPCANIRNRRIACGNWSDLLTPSRNYYRRNQQQGPIVVQVTMPQGQPGQGQQQNASLITAPIQRSPATQHRAGPQGAVYSTTTYPYNPQGSNQMPPPYPASPNSDSHPYNPNYNN